jgi:hypothetical protein
MLSPFREREADPPTSLCRDRRHRGCSRAAIGRASGALPDCERERRRAILRRRPRSSDARDPDPRCGTSVQVGTCAHPRERPCARAPCTIENRVRSFAGKHSSVITEADWLEHDVRHRAEAGPRGALVAEQEPLEVTPRLPRAPRYGIKQLDAGAFRCAKAPSDPPSLARVVTRSNGHVADTRERVEPRSGDVKGVRGCPRCPKATSLHQAAQEGVDKA